MPNKSFAEDFLTIASGALSSLMEERGAFKARAKRRLGDVAREMDLVGRDEFDAAFAMLAKARAMQEELAARLARVESELGLSSGKKPVKTKKPSLPSVKPAARRAGKKSAAKRR